jgi:prefoldin subunit 5
MSRLEELEAENKRLREAYRIVAYKLEDVRQILDETGDFPVTVSKINAAQNEAEDVLVPKGEPDGKNN